MSGAELEKLLKMFLDAQKQKKNQFAEGKQTLKELVGQNAGVPNIDGRWNLIHMDKKIGEWERTMSDS